MLFEIFSQIEAGQDWPRICDTARVVMLAKPGEALNSPSNVRPITILSTIYRAYSSYRATQLLQHLGNLVPAQVGGIASRLCADCLAALVCDAIDVGYADNVALCGLVVGLKKCFNMIPRKPMIALMNKLNIPAEYIRSQQSMLSQLTRYIEIKGEIGQPISSVCGFPEGCALSVVTMAALTILAANEMSIHEDVMVTMYADNWGLICKTIEQLQHAFVGLEQLVSNLQMKISNDKSWSWGTTATMRKRLKTIRLCDALVPSKISAKDLGCDVSYGRGIRKATAKQR